MQQADGEQETSGRSQGKSRFSVAKETEGGCGCVCDGDQSIVCRSGCTSPNLDHSQSRQCTRYSVGVLSQREKRKPMLLEISG